jgi:ketosteroid isomerase-like protein
MPAYGQVTNRLPDTSSRSAGRWRSLEFEPQKFFAQNDMVVVLGRYALSVKSTGMDPVETDWVHAFTFRGRKITEFRGYEDSAAVVAAFTKP